MGKLENNMRLKPANKKKPHVRSLASPQLLLILTSQHSTGPGRSDAAGQIITVNVVIAASTAADAVAVQSERGVKINIVYVFFESPELRDGQIGAVAITELVFDKGATLQHQDAQGEGRDHDRQQQHPKDPGRPIGAFPPGFRHELRTGIVFDHIALLA